MKVLFSLILLISVCVANPVDTVNREPVYVDSSLKTDLTRIIPKTKTNWSRIKDLFL